jgi:hypothetical protein
MIGFSWYYRFLGMEYRRGGLKRQFGLAATTVLHRSANFA